MTTSRFTGQVVPRSGKQLTHIVRVMVSLSLFVFWITEIFQVQSITLYFLKFIRNAKIFILRIVYFNIEVPIVSEKF
jgi:hypothetical protein